ncbi:MAG: hypothetical protein A2X78_03860 [Gammaproteobacteria bacterium GWE2_37_16]|nr:MAG: hypothetical protein A2X78_03860 [Gammaproteobacteria bacterium GWE2_37_16]
MFKTEYSNINSYLKNNQITREELFRQAVDGKVELLLYLTQFEGSIVGFEKVEISGLCKLAPSHCEKLLAEAMPNKFLLNKTMELIEGEYKIYIDKQVNKQRTVGWETVKVKPQTKSLIFAPLVYSEKEKDHALNPQYQLEAYAKQPNGKVYENIYCYSISTENILVLKQKSQFNLIDNCVPIEQYQKENDLDKRTIVEKIIQGDLEAFVYLDGAEGRLENSTIPAENPKSVFSNLIKEFGSYTYYNLVIEKGLCKLNSSCVLSEYDNFLIGNDISLKYKLELEQGKLRIYNPAHPKLFNEYIIESSNNENICIIPLSSKEDKENSKYKITKCKHGSTFVNCAVLNQEVYCYVIPIKDILILKRYERLVTSAPLGKHKEALRFCIDNNIPVYIFLQNTHISVGLIDFERTKKYLQWLFLDSELSNKLTAIGDKTTKPQFAEYRILFGAVRKALLVLAQFFFPNSPYVGSDCAKSRDNLINAVANAVFKHEPSQSEYNQISRVFAEIHKKYLPHSELLIEEKLLEERLQIAQQIATGLQFAVTMGDLDTFNMCQQYIKQHDCKELVDHFVNFQQDCALLANDPCFHLSKDQLLAEMVELLPKYLLAEEKVNSFVYHWIFIWDIICTDNYHTEQLITSSHYLSNYEQIRRRELNIIYDSGKCKIQYLEAPKGKYKKITKQEDARLITENDLYISVSDKLKLELLNCEQHSIVSSTSATQYVFRKNVLNGRKNSYSFIFEGEQGGSAYKGFAYLHFLIENKDKSFTHVDLLERIFKQITPLPKEPMKLKKLRSKKDLYSERRDKFIGFTESIKNIKNFLGEAAPILIKLKEYVLCEYEKEKKYKTKVLNNDFSTINNIVTLRLFINDHIKRLQKELNSIENKIIATDPQVKALKNTRRAVTKTIKDCFKKYLEPHHPKLYAHLENHLKYDSSKRTYTYHSGTNPIPWEL